LLLRLGLNQGFVLTKHEFYHLSHTSILFAAVILKMGSHKLFA
jgi:hypothetical protein